LVNKNFHFVFNLNIIALAFTSGGFFGYLLRSIRPIAILTSMAAGAALGSLVTYEYVETDRINNQEQYENFHD
jgi:hypothetical protein